MHEFRTTFSIPQAKIKFNYLDNLTLIGSCFTENIGNRLSMLKFKTIVNPFGILYNPLSINTCMQQIINVKHYSQDDLLFYNDKWLSLNHHGCFSNVDVDICLDNINKSIINMHDNLISTKYIFITFGTSIVYFFKETGNVVGNCHKMPAEKFYMKRVSLDETVKSIENIVNSLTKLNPNINIVLTVSPIRHWKDGPVENQLSKSTLLLAVNELVKHHDNVAYFPVYEIMNDDLRDYRFYEEDMIHPNNVAIKYIWELFINTFMDESCIEPMKLVEKLNTALAHRITADNSTEYNKFTNYLSTLKDNLKRQYPFIEI